MSNFDKFPKIKVPTTEKQAWQGWPAISEQLQTLTGPLTFACETYHGIDHEEVLSELSKSLEPKLTIDTRELLKTENEILEMTEKDITDDPVFGRLTHLKLIDFFDPEKIAKAQSQLNDCQERTLIFGPGATLLSEDYDCLLYADMPRWEIQQRMRKGPVDYLGVRDDSSLSFTKRYKRGYFVDWRVLDRHKTLLIDQWDYVLDTVKKDNPVMITAEAFRAGLKQAANQPFRVVPFFDPGPWGGQWMKEVCDLDRSVKNFAWCFDCVPEENSLLFEVESSVFETPSINLVLHHPKELLGNDIFGRFGAEFPIRFDFLDTVKGGNLSLQVHPTTEYIKSQHGMPYTQDESYYFLDAEPGSHVYLGLKDSVDSQAMLKELEQAQENGSEFNAEKHVQKWPVKKHDHVLIPAGTVHCSGAGTMVLEISSTPYIFTYKLWDWGRMGLDGRPRPIHLNHGKNVIQWDRTKSWTEKNLVNRFAPITEGDGWREEKTGLHELEFIETRRHWFTKPVEHNTNGTVNVLNLVEGQEAIVESPTDAFKPFIVHYAETFIVPAAVGCYRIRPHGPAEGKECATLKAYVRGEK